jgi:hypothetical protein
LYDAPKAFPAHVSEPKERRTDQSVVPDVTVTRAGAGLAPEYAEQDEYVVQGGERMNNKPYRIALLAIVAIVLLPVVAAAQSPFDGTWKQDLSKSKIHMKPLVYLLQDGIYHCETCPAPFTIKADG